MNSHTPLLLLLLIIAPAVGAQGFNLELYKPTTIAALAEEARKTKEQVGHAPTAEDTVVMPVERYRIRLSYAGAVRTLSAENKGFIQFVAKSFPHIPSEQWVAYTHEIHVNEGATQLWLPIQGRVLETLIPALPSGAEFEVYVFWLGENRGQQVCVINTAKTFAK